MNKCKKKISLKFILILLLAVFCMGLIGASVVTFSADALETVNGAQIKEDADNIGIRFSARITPDEYDYVYNQEENNVNKTFGMFVIPTDKIVVGSKLEDTQASLVVYFPKSFVTQPEGQTYYEARGVLIDIYLHNVNREFIGISFIREVDYNTSPATIKYTYDSNICSSGTITEENLNTIKSYGRSVAYVASQAWTNGDEEVAYKDLMEKAIYASYGFKENDGHNTGYFYNGNTYATYDEMKTAYPITMSMKNSDMEIANVGLRQGDSYTLSPTLMLDGREVDLVSLRLPAIETSSNNANTTYANNTVTANSIGSSSITASYPYITSAPSKTVSVNNYVDYKDTSLYVDKTPNTSDVQASLYSGNGYYYHYIRPNNSDYYSQTLPNGSVIVINPGYVFETIDGNDYQWISSYTNTSNAYVVNNSKSDTICIKVLAADVANRGTALTSEQLANAYKIYMPKSAVDKTIKGTIGYSAGALKIMSNGSVADTYSAKCYIPDTTTEIPGATVKVEGNNYTVTGLNGDADSGYYEIKITSDNGYNQDAVQKVKLDSATTVNQAVNFTKAYISKTDNVIQNDTALSVNGNYTGTGFTATTTRGMDGAFRFKVTTSCTNTGVSGSFATGGIRVMVGSEEYIFITMREDYGTGPARLVLNVIRVKDSQIYTDTSGNMAAEEYRQGGVIAGTGCTQTMEMFYANGIYLLKINDNKGNSIQYVITSQNAVRSDLICADDDTKGAGPIFEGIWANKGIHGLFSTDAGVTRTIGVGNGSALSGSLSNVTFQDIEFENLGTSTTVPANFVEPIIGKVDKIVTGERYYVTADSGKSYNIANRDTGYYAICSNGSTSANIGLYLTSAECTPALYLDSTTVSVTDNAINTDKDITRPYSSYTVESASVSFTDGSLTRAKVQIIHDSIPTNQGIDIYADVSGSAGLVIANATGDKYNENNQWYTFHPVIESGVVKIRLFGSNGASIIYSTDITDATGIFGMGLYREGVSASEATAGTTKPLNLVLRYWTATTTDTPVLVTLPFVYNTSTFILTLNDQNYEGYDAQNNGAWGAYFAPIFTGDVALCTGLVGVGGQATFNNVGINRFKKAYSYTHIPNFYADSQFYISADYTGDTTISGTWNGGGILIDNGTTKYGLLVVGHSNSAYVHIIKNVGSLGTDGAETLENKLYNNIKVLTGGRVNIEVLYYNNKLKVRLNGNEVQEFTNTEIVNNNGKYIGTINSYIPATFDNVFAATDADTISRVIANWGTW